MLGYHTRRLANEGLLAIGFTNAPASIAPVGGRRPVVGTNPFSLAAPDGDGGVAVLIDQSASVIAKSEIMKHAREGLPIPPVWALDPDGQPTTDPEIALKGSMAPSGGYKGVGVALMVEIMAAAMTGATLGVDASPFSGTQGGPPKTGQFFLAISPDTSSGGLFAERIAALVGELRDQPGVRVPGDGRKAARRRAESKGVAVNPATLEKIDTWLRDYQELGTDPTAPRSEQIRPGPPMREHRLQFPVNRSPNRSVRSVHPEKKLRKSSGCGTNAAQGLKPTCRAVTPIDRSHLE